MDHAVDTLLELDERAVGREVADLALDLRADGVAVLHGVPRVVLGLADAESDLLVLHIDGEHDHLDFITDREHVARAGDALCPAELADVDEAFDSGGDFDECAVRSEVDDLAGDARTDGELVLYRVPGVGLGLLETEAHALAVAVDVENHDIELVADLEDFARVLDAAPGHVGDVQEAVEAVEIDERAEVGDVLDLALADLALLERGHELRLLLGHRALDELAARDDKIAALVGNLDDLEVVGLADVGLEILDGNDLDLRAGQERLDVVDLDEQTAAHGALDRTRDDTALDIAVENLLPADLVVRSLLGERDHAGLVVLKLAEHHRYLVAYLDIGAVAEFVGRDDTLRLVADVDEYIAVLDSADGAFDQAAVLELRLLTCACEHLRHRGGTLRRRSRLANCHCLFFRLLLFADFSRVRPVFGRGECILPKIPLAAQWGILRKARKRRRHALSTAA